MCTISLVPSPDSINGFILTSNRDEAVSRKTLPPSDQVYKNRKMHFPMDERAGGTWIGVSDRLRCICLMNGAEKPHARQDVYRKSRGVVVKDFLAGKSLNSLMNDYGLDGIEPFTMILIDWSNGLIFSELIWDGETRKILKLAMKEHIWSSSPLYSEEMKGFRQKWFRELKQTEGFNSESILDFHHSAGKGNLEYGLVIDRGFLKTQSITQIHNSKKDLRFWYKNLINNEVTENYLQFKA